MVSRSSRPLHDELQEIVDHLKQLPAILAVAVSTLREQSADLDADVATLLQRAVSDPLHDQVRKLEGLVSRLPPAPHRKR
jgi:ABC-type transporter Mla subunit MlaD